MTEIKSKEIRLVEIEKIVPNPKNNNKHTKAQIERLSKIIKYNGFRNPLIISKRSGFLIAGHGRLEAAKELGLEKLPVVYQEFQNEAEEYQFLTADNEIARWAELDKEKLKDDILDLGLEKDFDLELLGLDDFDIDLSDPEGGGSGDSEEDEIPEVEKNDIVKRGDIWILGDHRLMCGDSTCKEDVDKLMNEHKADMVFTDPPYGVSYASKNEFLNNQDKGNRIQREIKNDHMTLDETGILWSKTFSNWHHYLNEYSSYYIASPQGGDLFLMMMMMNENNFPLRHCLIWNKNNHVLGRCDYNYKHEPILYGWKNKHKFYNKGTQNKSVVDFNKPLKNDLHPTMKPIELIENFILNSTMKEMLVIDMFLGSGSTLIACEKTNRKCYGMELDEHYCSVIIERWQEFTGREAYREIDNVKYNDIKAQETDKDRL